MTTLLIAAALALPCGHSADGSDAAPASLDDIMESWSTRSDSVPRGTIRWSVPAESCNLFGRFETLWLPRSETAGDDIVGTMAFDQQQARYDSTSFSFAEYTALSSWRGLGMPSFAAALAGVFEDPRYEYRALLPCTVMYLPGQGVQFWHDPANQRPLVLVLPAGPAMGVEYLSTFVGFDTSGAAHRPAGFSTHLHHMLAAPALLTFRPFLFDPGLEDADACEMDHHLKPVYEGTTCQVLRVTETGVGNQSTHGSVPTERLYWVDPTRDFVVVRCIIRWDGVVFSQIDIQYEPMDEVGWGPAKWSVLRFGDHPHVVRQGATAVVENVDVGPSVTQVEGNVRLSPGTWVVDRVRSRQYVVRDDFSEEDIEGGNFFPPTSWATPARGTARGGAGWARKIRRILVKLARWPGVLIPVMVISGALIATKALLTRRGNRRRRPATVENQTGSPIHAEETERR